MGKKGTNWGEGKNVTYLKLDSEMYVKTNFLD